MIVTLAIDIGGTGSRTLLVDESGNETVDEFGRPERAETALATLRRIVVETKERHDLSVIDAVRAGLTGFNGYVPDIGGFASVLSQRAGVSDLIVADDSVPWALDALGGMPGVTVALGTGIVALGVSQRGQLAHVDGSGPYLGDRGSGWWVGRQGLVAAIGADEGRAGGSESLLAAARERFGDLRELPETLRRDPNPHATIATFAIDVVRAAETGDSEAKRILASVGQHVATAAAAAARRSDLPSEFSLALVGGLSKASDLFGAALHGALAAEGLRVDLISAQSDVLRGALLLDTVADDQTVVRRWIREEH